MNRRRFLKFFGAIAASITCMPAALNSKGHNFKLPPNPIPVSDPLDCIDNPYVRSGFKAIADCDELWITAWREVVGKTPLSPGVGNGTFEYDKEKGVLVAHINNPILIEKSAIIDPAVTFALKNKKVIKIDGLHVSNLNLPKGILLQIDSFTVLVPQATRRTEEG
jgi:hypothetical protein